ncbi:luciferin sulfotransferase-like [Culicoides brevitarsis]|uniref:luciferin sulfotransferase-like n=1 Tax=Culicoides brevitarsis TaxID=469753 RepID=UPI00307C9B7D
MSSLKWEKIEDPRINCRIDAHWNNLHYKQSLKGGEKEENRCCVLSARYKAYMDLVKNYEVREDDIWICTYPKSGTTWTQEMVWAINNGCDLETAKKLPLSSRSPTLRKIISIQAGIDDPADVFVSMDPLNQVKPPYHIKNHLPAGLLPDKLWTVKPKIIYVARHPKDAAISFYHYYRMVYQYEGTKDDFLSLFLEGLTEFGQQTTHLYDFWRMRNEPNILFLTYEDMKKDLTAVLKQVANFLDKELSEKQIEELKKHLHIDSMRENTVVFNVKNNAELAEKLKTAHKDFFRRGEAGSHKDEMSEEMSKKFDALIKRELTDKGCNLYKPEQ